MNSRFALPFLTLPEETVKFDGWRIGDPGEPLLAAQDVLENWDYARDLEIACTIAFDWLRASNALQLPTDKLQLKVALVIGTGVETCREGNFDYKNSFLVLHPDRPVSPAYLVDTISRGAFA